MQVFFVVVSVLCVFFILSHIYFKKFLLMNYSISSGFIVVCVSPWCGPQRRYHCCCPTAAPGVNYSGIFRLHALFSYS